MDYKLVDVAKKKMNEEIYYVSERGDIKKKIIKDLEKRLI
jgi:hypothetical protein|tara:strand:+ start:970 stop:1089 length:120 start_codon:yes stop_codon:yes gene_type:complete